MWTPVSETEFRTRFYTELGRIRQEELQDIDFVSGPGRSGAVASVYASHHLGIPFKPHKCGNYSDDTAMLLVDTAEYTGKTLRKATNYYERQGLLVYVVYAYKEERKHYYRFWYEVF